MNYNQDCKTFLSNKFNFKLSTQHQGIRLDVVLTKILSQYSRSQIINWIKNGDILINNNKVKAKYMVIGDENIDITIPSLDNKSVFLPENIPLDIIFEDEDILIINKPANIVVHPAAGNWNGTLLNALLNYLPNLSSIPRAGIVHRLDKDTSGLMVIAKNIISQNSLVQQLQNRQVKRIYRAIANGKVPFDGKIETLIGRNPYNRTKMSVVQFGGKLAITNIKILEYFNNHTYIECSLETGRTHQIRVHLQETNHHIVGDQTYGNNKIKCSLAIKEQINQLSRQALHAYKLEFFHHNKIISFQSPIPQDIKKILDVLRQDKITNTSLKENDDIT